MPIHKAKKERHGELLNHALALKFSIILGIILFVLVLLKTNIRHKQRPILILCLCAGYLALQLILPIEFFPFSAYPARSYAESAAARYVKVYKVLEGGDVVALGPHPLLWSFAGGQAKRSSENFFDSQQACDHFAHVYSTYDFSRDPRVGRPMVRELRLESWKWDWMQDPHNPDFGFLVKRMVCKA